MAGFDVVLDSSMPLETIYMLPRDVQIAIETAKNIESAHNKGRASHEMLDAAVRYAEGVIRDAAEEKRIGVIKNVAL